MRAIVIRFFIFLALLAGLAACKGDVPLTVADQKKLGISSVRVVSVATTKLGAVTEFTVGGKKQILHKANIKSQVERSVRRNLAGINGPKKVNVRIAVLDYYWPHGLTKVLVGSVPFMITDVTLYDAKTGKVIDGKRRVGVSGQDFKSLNWAVNSPYGAASDHQYYPMIGIYGRKLRKWLTTQQQPL